MKRPNWLTDSTSAKQTRAVRHPDSRIAIAVGFRDDEESTGTADSSLEFAHTMFKLNRREILRIGALSVLGTVTGATWRASGGQRQGNGNQAIFIMLQGGPSHLELWDPKPQAAREIRGPFDSIPTRIPGVLFGELMQHTARIADRITVIRSMSHQFTNHIAGTYVTMTGSNNQPDQDR